MKNNIQTIFIVGPTASGKTALALDIAKIYKSEIICADSRTIYKGLDIATAKPSAAECATVPHHGIDLITPDQSYSAGQFQHDAREWLAAIHGRGNLAMVVGGTGLYVDGLYYNFTFSDAFDAKLRSTLEHMTLDELQAYVRAKGIPLPENSKNKRYLIRAVERGGVTGGKGDPLPHTMIIGLLPDRDILDDRIKLRGHAMIAAGGVEEAEQLFEHYGYEVPAASAPFYKAFAPYCRGEADADSCLERFYLNDRQLSKRQITWFKRNPHIKWFKAADDAYDFVYKTLKS